jgi:hypothetical protein
VCGLQSAKRKRIEVCEAKEIPRGATFASHFTSTWMSSPYSDSRLRNDEEINELVRELVRKSLVLGSMIAYGPSASRHSTSPSLRPVF